MTWIWIALGALALAIIMIAVLWLFLTYQVGKQDEHERSQMQEYDPDEFDDNNIQY